MQDDPVHEAAQPYAEQDAGEEGLFRAAPHLSALPCPEPAGPNDRLQPRCTTLRGIAAPSSEDDLYGLPLGEFTAARNELEKRLRREGERERAKEVKALRKPTAPAWALNQLARQRGKDVKRLVAAGERLRTAQEQLIKGGDREELAEAAAEERELVGELARAGAAIAGEGGVATGAALDEKLRATLHAAATDEDTARELLAGRLTREREAVGLFGLVEAPAPDAKSTPQPKQKASGSPKTAAEDDEARARQQKARELERELKAATSAEKKAQRSVQSASRGAATALERAEAATERLEAAEAEQREAEAALEEASDEVRRLEEELSRLRD